MTATRARLAVLVAVVASVAVVGVMLLARGAEGGSGTLAWKGTPDVMQAGRPTDRVLYGQIRNDSLEKVDLTVDDVRVLDADGHEVQSAVRFLAAFAHGLYPWSQRPDPLGDFERRRMGQIVTLKAGQTAPVTLSWRVPRGGAQPVRVDFGAAEIELPGRAG